MAAMCPTPPQAVHRIGLILIPAPSDAFVMRSSTDARAEGSPRCPPAPLYACGSLANALCIGAVTSLRVFVCIARPRLQHDVHGGTV